MYRSALFLAVGVVVVALGLLVAQEGNYAKVSDQDDQSAMFSEKIHREGTRVDQKAPGFRTENDRLLVQSGLDQEVEVLENLGAQRIYRAGQDDPEDNQWTVSGFLTEFEGRNYLLIEQAVRIR